MKRKLWVGIIGMLLFISFGMNVMSVQASTRTMTITIDTHTGWFGWRYYKLEVKVWVTSPGTWYAEITDAQLKLFTTTYVIWPGWAPTRDLFQVTFFSSDGNYWWFSPLIYAYGMLQINPEFIDPYGNHWAEVEVDNEYAPDLDGQDWMKLKFTWFRWDLDFDLENSGSGYVTYDAIFDTWYSEIYET